MSEFNAVKDSGQRREFGTGSVRDVRDGKGRYDLLPPGAIFRLARHFENGAKKYGDNNWLKGQPLSGYLDSGLRHGFKILAGMKDEDHAAAAAWNFMAFIETAMRIEDGRLPKELDDIGYTSRPDQQVDDETARRVAEKLNQCKAEMSPERRRILDELTPKDPHNPERFVAPPPARGLPTNVLYREDYEWGKETCEPNPEWKDCCLQCRTHPADDKPGQLCEHCRTGQPEGLPLPKNPPANSEPAQCEKSECHCKPSSERSA